MSQFDHHTEAGLRSAVQQLRKSETGQSTLRILSAWLSGSGTSLDARNKDAAMALIAGAWGPACGTALDLMQEAVDPVPV